jgi:hypothetical protein
MTKENFRKLITLKQLINSIYGLTRHIVPNIPKETWDEYQKLRREYAECNGKIEEV